MTVAPREHRVTTPRIELSVRERDGGDPPIVMLHGLASNARWWDLVGEHLAPAHRVIAVDQRGHGLSDKPADGYDLEGAVADLEALVAAMQLPPAVIVGHSWGATVALGYAARFPDAVVATVCVDGGVLRLRDHFGDTWDLAAVAMAPPQMHGLTPERIAGWISESPMAEGSDPATTVEIMLGNFAPSPTADELQPRLTFDRHMMIARALYDADGAALLASQRKPVLVVPAVGGDLDDARRAAVETAVRELGDLATVTPIVGIHDLPVQRPREVADAILAFLGTVGAGGAR